MTRNIFGWDLPPGCTQRHIDEAAGAYDDDYQDDDFDDAGLEHAEADYQDQLLMGPLAHKLVRGSWVVDFSRPGALARYAAEATEWWSKNWDKDCVR